jgi:hypothetical protein
MEAQFLKGFIWKTKAIVDIISQQARIVWNMDAKLIKGS